MYIFYIVINFVLNCCLLKVKCETFDCHDDPGYSPRDGMLGEIMFTWLGVLQYIHIQKGTPHYFRVPRVVLVSPQFVLSTAMDAALVPPGYALGNIVFGEYERDEEECGYSMDDLDAGKLCDPAVMLMPIADVLLHPEYKDFGIKNSVALLKMLKPVTSLYMLPVCLPYKNYLFNKENNASRATLRHVDYPAEAPRDFSDELKEVKSVTVVPRELCTLYGETVKYGRRYLNNNASKTHGRTICTTGCGFHSGSPSVIHELTGHWTVVSLSTGGPQCPDPLRSKFVPKSPQHIPIYPYVPWITSQITGKVVGASSNDDPFGYVMDRGALRQAVHLSIPEKKGRRKGWVGHWWMGGLRCYDRGEAADDLYRFYFDIFEVDPTDKVHVLKHHLQIDSPRTTMIDCVKVGMPWFAPGAPLLWDLPSSAVKICIPYTRHKVKYRINIEAWGHNITGQPEAAVELGGDEEEEGAAEGGSKSSYTDTDLDTEESK